MSILDKLKGSPWVDNPWVRWVAGIGLLLRGQFFLVVGRRYRGISDLCRVVRISSKGLPRRIAHDAVMKAVQEIKLSGVNFIVDDYRADSASSKYADLYSICGSGASDIFRDVIVLKRATSDEKGVILLKYGKTFEAMFAIFDMGRLMERYYFVLEPCWAGYCDPAILMYLAPGHPVFIQAFTEEDYEFIAEIGQPFVPLRLGPGDWVDAELLQPDTSATKLYDVVMVANWAAHKRHRQLFRSLRDIRNRKLKVLLIGFPWEGRTAADIRRESMEAANPNVSYEIVESIPQAAVARYLSQCRVFVFLSKKEGDNKALVEAMFADVPAIVYKHSIGGAPNRITPETGLLSSDRDLARNVLYVLDHRSEFSPREWALAHTGSNVATRVLNNALRRVVEAGGELWRGDIVEKVNSPNLEYKDLTMREGFVRDVEFLVSVRLS